MKLVRVVGKKELRAVYNGERVEIDKIHFFPLFQEINVNIPINVLHQFKSQRKYKDLLQFAEEKHNIPAKFNLCGVDATAAVPGNGQKAIIVLEIDDSLLYNSIERFSDNWFDNNPILALTSGYNLKVHYLDDFYDKSNSKLLYVLNPRKGYGCEQLIKSEDEIAKLQLSKTEVEGIINSKVTFELGLLSGKETLIDRFGLMLTGDKKPMCEAVELSIISRLNKLNTVDEVDTLKIKVRNFDKVFLKDNGISVDYMKEIIDNNKGRIDIEYIDVE